MMTTSPASAISFRDFRNATDVFYPVVRRKSKIRVQAVADIVSVQDIDLHVAAEQIRFQGVGQGRFARTGQPGEPYDHASMTVSFSSNPMINRAFGPKDVCALNGLPLDVSSSEDNSTAGHILIDRR